MPVAKTYANMALQGEPFQENGRMYVNVLAPKGIKKVRWYSDAEYQRMYPGSEIKKNDVMDFNARHAFGFDELGYITIYRGNEIDIKECVESHHEFFRYNLTFGYYTPSRLSICSLPDSITPIRLSWEEVMDHDDRMKPHDIVQKIVSTKLGVLSYSVYQGQVNEWLQKTVKVIEKTSKKEGPFGIKHTYILEDSDRNMYIWETGAKNLACSQTISLKMKVKEHKEINSNQVTVVWYCKEC